MSNGKLDEFLAGERPDDVALFLTHDFLDGEGKVANYGERVDGGVVLVVDGDKGRRMFASGTGMDAMEFARGAMETEGRIDRDLSGGDPPDGGDVQFVFAFAEAQNEEVGGIYAEGDVIHAYAYSSEGSAFSDRWVVDAA
jgi:hypothetical protein